MEKLLNNKFNKLTKPELNRICGGADVVIWVGNVKGREVLSENACKTQIDGSQISVRTMGPTAWQKFWRTEKQEAKLYGDQTDEARC